MLWFLIIGLIAGWLAGKIVEGIGFGLICDLAAGVIGSLTGGYLSGILGFGGIMTATIGAVVFLLLIRSLYSLMKLYIYYKIELP